MATIIVTLFLASMAFNITPAAAGTDSWTIGEFEPTGTYPGIVDEFASPYTLIDYHFDFYIGDPVNTFPAGIKYPGGEVAIHFSVLTPGIFNFTYAKWGSETDEIYFYLDGTLIEIFPGLGEGVWSVDSWPITIPDRNMHTILVKVIPSGVDSQHWFDAFSLELLTPSDEKILLGKITHEDAISKVNAAVKYKVVDDKLILEFQTVYFVRADSRVQWLGYFIVPKFFDYEYTVLSVWGKTFKPGRGGYVGDVVVDVNAWLFHGDVWAGEPTGDNKDALVFADVDNSGSWADLETRMKIVVHQTIELPYDYSGTIDYCVRGVSAGPDYWEHRYTIGTV